MIYIIAHGFKGPVSISKAGAGWAASRNREKTIANATVTNEMCKHPFIPQIHICTVYKNGNKTTEIRIWDVAEGRFVFDRSFRSITPEDLKAIDDYEEGKRMNRGLARSDK